MTATLPVQALDRLTLEYHIDIAIGAAVLAQSLKDSGTTKKLAVLVTKDSVHPSTIDELKVWPFSETSRCACVLTLSTEPLRLCHPG